MKAQPLKLVDGQYITCNVFEATHLKIKFPVAFSPLKERIISVQASGKREGTANWSWNKDVNFPTLKPSILTHWQAGDGNGNLAPDILCHSFVADGMVQFLSDCTHELAGNIVPLLDIEVIAQ
jgi:Family of unknown function (DUF6527)